MAVKAIDLLFSYFLLNFGVLAIKCITLKQECPPGEVHMSCSFQSEYTCWISVNRLQRVKEVSKRLSHCKAGCFCRRGLVREFPDGPCIISAACRNRKLQADLKSIPTLNIWVLRNKL